jgi:Amt family ammonium transporter
MKFSITLIVALLLGLLAPATALAEGPAGAETAYLFNTLFILVCGVLVMFMAAGFAMLEAGMVRSKSVAVICTKNIALYSVAGIMFYLVGYQLMYGPGSFGLFGSFSTWFASDQQALAGNFDAGMATSADWFFQMVFVATAASVVSGALAERVRFWPFVIFVMIMAGLLYPVVGHWTWGGGWLSEIGFSDFAGSTIVHSIGGWAALTGAIMLGPRAGRFAVSGEAINIPPSSLPLVTLGTFILWLGWFGFNGGSQLAFGGAADAVSVANIFVNTNIAAAGGVVTVMAVSQLIYKRLDLPLILNGALAGLVSITAEPLMPNPGQAMMIGSIGALVMIGGSWLLQRYRIDDVVGAVPVHLFAGIWGTLAVALTNPGATVGTQFVGVAAVGLFVGIGSLVTWGVLRSVRGIRIHPEDECSGADLAEVGLRAYEF